jgi:UDP:flavonoid glycosyltransferase YjiC (YdhE family)
VVVTPGSANRQAAAFFRAAIGATERINRRALLVTGYREQLPGLLPVHTLHVTYAPFSMLFPRAAAVVHHGGIGTCAQAIAAGVPQVVMPIGFDQPDNASLASRLGVAETIAPAQFTESRVAAALERLLSSKDVADRCQQWRDRIDRGGAVTRACDLIEDQYDRAVVMRRQAALDVAGDGYPRRAPPRNGGGPPMRAGGNAG